MRITITESCVLSGVWGVHCVLGVATRCIWCTWCMRCIQCIECLNGAHSVQGVNSVLGVWGVPYSWVWGVPGVWGYSVWSVHGIDHTLPCFITHASNGSLWWIPDLAWSPESMKVCSRSLAPSILERQANDTLMLQTNYQLYMYLLSFARSLPIA